MAIQINGGAPGLTAICLPGTYASLETFPIVLPPDATIATRRIGALAFHSERRVFDYVYGLTERDVASRVAALNDCFY